MFHQGNNHTTQLPPTPPHNHRNPKKPAYFNTKQRTYKNEIIGTIAGKEVMAGGGSYKTLTKKKIDRPPKKKEIICTKRLICTIGDGEVSHKTCHT